jgi:hypothetical protein
MFEFKQKVWCVMLGEGVVRNILASDTRFPLVVEFNGKLECYTLDGKCMLNTTQALFPHPVEVIKKVTKPSINWEHVDSKFNYLAEDSCGAAFLYKEEPFIASTSWGIQRGEAVEAFMFASYVQGTCNWKESLVKRPTGNSGDD